MEAPLRPEELETRKRPKPGAKGRAVLCEAGPGLPASAGKGLGSGTSVTLTPDAGKPDGSRRY